MKSPSLRYSNQELLYILQKIAIDTKLKPSQRIITSNPTAPTHHTYVKRFGSVINALQEAGLSEMDTQQVSRKLIWNSFSFGLNMKESVEVNDIIVDVEFTSPSTGEIFYVDYVGLDGVDDSILDKHAEHRSMIMSQYHYIQLRNVGDIMNESKRIRKMEVY